MKKHIIIALDPGHGGHDPGAVGPTGLREKDVALCIAEKVGSILKQHGITVQHTRQDDRFVELSNRAKIANDAKADFFVSIHLNSATNPAATGTETFAYRQGTTGDRLSKSIQDNLVKEIKLRDRGVKHANFTVLSRTIMPAALVEVAFINNPSEEMLLKEELFKNKAAIGIAKGILEFLEVRYTEEKTKNEEHSDTLKEIKLSVNKVDSTVEGIFYSGRNYIPVGFLRELGFDVSWDSKTETVKIDFRKE